ncbi:hypothetical protein EHF33_06835 [Deinococcus psychrotolerans]|uniref:DUF1795 domain-containing protein n=1 Tax=Deinococcus psychrotolerans TaxID=2489213 RepID=A0A3G8YAT6_9DEIO|nr:hypothetical protein [Deinococcus psychrotolerans]AZI42499.1 hypothetical protein EHF33_06835 [Deinococcus psychrotolerans]
MRPFFVQPVIRPLVAFAALNCGLGGAAYALTPPAGWISVDANTWRDQSGACVLREQSFAQEFAPMSSQQDALSMGNKLQKALAKQGMMKVSIQPVSQQSDWSVLAAYTYAQSGVNYQIVQLYLSQGGKLHTLSGSNTEGEASACVNLMRNFIKGK